MPTQLSLRQADAILQILTEELKSISFESTIDVEPYGDVHQQLAIQRSRCLSDLARSETRAKVITTLRRLVGTANASAGISDILADIAGCDRLTALYTEAEKVIALPSRQVIDGNVQRILASEARPYGNTYSAGYLTDTDLEEIGKKKETAKLTKMRLKDKLLHLNVATKITVDGDVEQFLKEFNYL